MSGRDSSPHSIALAACPAAVHTLLRHAVGVLLIFPKEPEAEPTVLSRIAERHSGRDLAVPRSLYGPFVDSLIPTLKQDDPAFTPEVEHAWRSTAETGVAYMTARY